MLIQKIDPKKLPDVNIAKYYLLTLTLSLSKQKERESSLVVIVYDTLLQYNLNVNTFRTHIFIYSHFYLIFFCYVLTYLAPSFPSTLPMIAVFWYEMEKVNVLLYLPNS